MRILIQHVKQALVKVEGETVGQIGKGLLVFLGVHREDTTEDCQWIKEKLLNVRIFPDSNGKMNLSIQDVKGELLVVSQFTLYADCRQGRRPSFDSSAPSALAAKLYQHLIKELRTSMSVQTGRFGAHMEVQLVNDGPLTFWLDSKEKVF